MMIEGYKFTNLLGSDSNEVITTNFELFGSLDVFLICFIQKSSLFWPHSDMESRGNCKQPDNKRIVGLCTFNTNLLQCAKVKYIT